SRWGIGGSRWGFLALWLAPSFAFALNVHVEDPGQTLIMGVVVALIGGYLIERAIETMTFEISRGIVWIAVAATLALERAWQFPDEVWRLQWLTVTALGAGMAMKLFRRK